MTSDKPGELLGPWERLSITERAGGVRIPVHARPRSSKPGILGVWEGALDVALASPPADGAANAELVGIVAKALEVRRGDVRIVVGASGRNKLVEVNAITPDDARERLRKARR